MYGKRGEMRGQECRCATEKCVTHYREEFSGEETWMEIVVRIVSEGKEGKGMYTCRFLGFNCKDNVHFRE